MNEIKCKVNKYHNYYSLEYKHNDETYTIEVPRTERNEFLQDGDTINVALGFDLTEEQVDYILEQEKKQK